MRVPSRWGAAVVAAAALACESSSYSKTTSGPGAENPGEEPAAPVVTEGPCRGGYVTLRLLGAGTGHAISALPVEASALEVSSGGPLAVASAAKPPLDLALPWAHRLGIVLPPPGATSVSVSFSITSGSVTTPAGTSALDVCTGPITFAFDPSKVDPANCHVVVSLDLARSVLSPPAEGGSATLLPQFKVLY